MQPFILHILWQPIASSLSEENGFKSGLLRMCAAHSPSVELHHDNEVFVDLTGTAHIKDVIDSLLHHIDETWRSPTSSQYEQPPIVTLAPNKFVARVGTLVALDTSTTGPARLSKSLFRRITETQVRDFLSPLSIRYLWPVERRIPLRLRHLGITTFHDLERVPRARLTNEFGAQLGSQLLSLAQGIDPTPVASHYPPRTIEVYHEFGNEHALNDLATLALVTEQLAYELAAKLFATGEACQALLMRMEFASGQLVHSLKLRTATWTKEVLAQEALRLMHRFTIDSWPYRVSLIAADLGHPHSKQHDLFLRPRDEMRQRIDKILAGVQRHYGMTSIRYASTLQKGRRERMRALWHDKVR